MKKLHLAVVGAYGLVGKKILENIESFKIEFSQLTLYGSKRSKNKRVKVNGKDYYIKELSNDSVDKTIDLVIFAAGSDVVKEYKQFFIDNKTYVVDNSSAFRNDDDIPLVIPGVNREDIKESDYLVSNPNCTTSQAVEILMILNDLSKLKRVDYTSYQAVSGSGYAGIEDLKNNHLNASNKLYPYQIVNNVIPLIDDFMDNGFTKEEIKMVNETKKILHLPQLEVSATCVRVPIENTHGLSLRIEVEKEISIDEFVARLEEYDGIIVKNDISKNEIPVADYVNGNDNIVIGRIRKDLFNDKVIHFFCVADNLRKGAATNSVQIAKYIIDQYL